MLTTSDIKRTLTQQQQNVADVQRVKRKAAVKEPRAAFFNEEEMLSLGSLAAIQPFYSAEEQRKNHQERSSQQSEAEEQAVQDHELSQTQSSAAPGEEKGHLIDLSA